MSATLVPPETGAVETISQTTLDAFDISAAEAKRWMQVAAIPEEDLPAFVAAEMAREEALRRAALLRPSYRPRSIGTRRRRTADELNDLLDREEPA